VGGDALGQLCRCFPPCSLGCEHLPHHAVLRPPKMAANKQFTLLGFPRALGRQCVRSKLADQRHNGSGLPLNKHERVYELRMAPKHASNYANRRWVKSPHKPTNSTAARPSNVKKE